MTRKRKKTLDRRPKASSSGKEKKQVQVEQAENTSRPVENMARRRAIDPMQMLCTQSIRKFKNLPVAYQTTKGKQLSIDTVLAFHKDTCGDPARFYSWILNQAELVKRTFDFTKVCENLGVKGHEQAIAEHLIMEGKAVCNNIRLNGLASYPGNIKMFIERLVPENYRFEITNNVGSNE